MSTNTNTSLNDIRERLAAYDEARAAYLAALHASPDEDTRERRMTKRAANSATQLLDAFAPDDLRYLLARVDALTGALREIAEMHQDLSEGDLLVLQFGRITPITEASLQMGLNTAALTARWALEAKGETE